MINQLDVTFAKAGKAAGTACNTSPHVLSAFAVADLKQQGFQDSDIMRVTAHATSERVFAYDQSSRAADTRNKVSLISQGF